MPSILRSITGTTIQQIARHLINVFTNLLFSYLTGAVRCKLCLCYSGNFHWSLTWTRKSLPDRVLFFMYYFISVLALFNCLLLVQFLFPFDSYSSLTENLWFSLSLLSFMIHCILLYTGDNKIGLNCLYFFIL